ncbi:MAG: MFS transporter [Bacilli bacterium]|nr:MFS transporter [Bacilli bacterium]
MASLLLAIIYLAFISLGLPDSLLGAAWPVIQTQMDLPMSAMGLLSFIICGGTVISSLLSERISRVLKTQWVVIISTFLVAGAMIGFSFSSTFWMLILFSIPYGLGSGAIDASLNNYVTNHYSAKHLTWLHAFWGVGTIVSPFIMSYAISKRTWESGYRIVGYIQLGLAIIIFASIFLWKNTKHEQEHIEQERLTPKEKLKIKGIFFVLIAFFAYCSCESIMMSWASTYFVKYQALSEDLAAALASLWFIGLTVSRIIFGFLTEKLSDKTLIRIGYTIMVISVILMTLAFINVYFAIVGFLLFGFGCGPIYPSIIHSAPNDFGPSKSASVIGLEMASAYIGATFTPPLFGLFTQYTDIKYLPFALITLLGLFIIMIEILNFKVNKRNATAIE